MNFLEALKQEYANIAYTEKITLGRINQWETNYLICFLV